MLNESPLKVLNEEEPAENIDLTRWDRPGKVRRVAPNGNKAQKLGLKIARSEGKAEGKWDQEFSSKRKLTS